MSRDPYRSSREDFGYSGGRGGGGNRWDTERFAAERRGGSRFDLDRDVYEERDTRVVARGGGIGRPRERSVDEIYERRGPRFEDDRYERRHYHDDDEPRFERERPWARDGGERTNVTIEKERVYSPSPPPRRSNRPNFLRRQSSLDTFDRKPLTRFVEREEYGAPARYRQPDIRPPPLTPIPLPKTRQLGPPPRRYVERDYEEIRVAEPDFYGDEEYRAYPERVREREIIRRKRRSRSRDSRSRRGSVRSDSISSSSSSDRETVRSEFPKKGKTRMPARLVSKKAIIDLGYPFEEEGDTIIIMKALGRENIDEVIKLSEDYKGDNDHIIETEHTTYLVGPGAEISGGRSTGGDTVYEERKTEQVFTVPPPPPQAGWNQPPPGWMPPPPPAPVQEVVTDTKITETHNHPHHHNGPIIVDATHPHHHHDTVIETKETQIIDRSEAIPVGALALAALPDRSRHKDERAIRAEIRALEAEKEALRAEKRADRELRKADRLRGGSRVTGEEVVLYDHDRNEDVTIIRKERIVEPEGGVRIEKDRKAAPPPRVIRAMLKTLT